MSHFPFTNTRRQAFYLVLASAMVFIPATALYYYNRLVELEQNVNSAERGIHRELRRRADLVPNVVSSVRRYSGLEKDIFTGVTGLRASSTASVPDEVGRSRSETGAAAPLDVAATKEQYPRMKAGDPSTLLMEMLAETEDRVAAARQNYNDRVRRYTTFASAFPCRVFAWLFRFEEKPLFVAEPAARLRPEVRRP